MTAAGVLRPPRLRTIARQERERHASWLELFFDLVFVVAIAELAHTLSGDLSLGGFARVAALFVPVWWLWVGYTIYADRFDTDDVPYRLLMLGGMLAVAGLAVTVHDALSEGAIPFAIAYVAAKLVLMGLYGRAWRHVPVARDLATRYLFALGAGAALWSLSIVVPAPARPWVWAAGLLVELTIPLLSLSVAQRTPIDIEHIPERFGLFTIIVLGESVVSIVRGVAETDWRPASALVATGGFVAIACLWWVYFSCIIVGGLRRRTVLAGVVFVYTHLPLVLGLTVVAVGIEHAILEADTRTLAAGSRWALCGGVALCLLCIAVLRRALVRPGGLSAPLAVAALALALALGGGPLPPLALGGTLLAGLVAAGGVEILRQGRQVPETMMGGPEGAQPAEDVPCTHLDLIRDVEPRTPQGCEECLKTGDNWVELRLCLFCGYVGCCDNSKNKHATAHFHATDHPLIQSFERGEDWRWCYVDQTYP